jgi:hypothetical protein
MDDPILLKQQIEFLQFEIDDAKLREVQTKAMYESMLKSFSSPSESSVLVEDLKFVKENHSQELKMIENKHRQTLQAYDRKLEDLTHLNNDLQDNIKRMQSRHEEIASQFKNDLLKANKDKSRLENALLQQKEDNERTLEKLNNEKINLQKVIEEQAGKLAVFNQGYLSEELEEILKTTGYRLEELERSQTLALTACSSLKSFISGSGSLPADLVPSMSAFLALVQSLEKNESKLREVIRQKDHQIHLLQKQESPSNYLINERDAEIIKLKKIIGDLRVEADVTSKPPMHTPKSKHGRSRTAFQPTENSPNVQLKDTDPHDSDPKVKKSDKNSLEQSECDNYKYLISSPNAYDHTPAYKIEYELGSPSNFSNTSTYDHRISMEKSEGVERHVKELRLAMGKLRNQRDKARLACEHLLMHLKNVKLQSAVSEERSCELQMELKQEIKLLIRSLLNFRSKYPLPLEAVSQIDKLVNKSSRFFGGKMHFQLED